MKKTIYSKFELKRRISKCKKRLHNLSLQGFSFSKDIYHDIAAFEKKITRENILNVFLKRESSKIRTTIIVLLIIIILLLTIPPLLVNSENISIEFTNLYDGLEIKKNRNISVKASIKGVSSEKIEGFIFEFKIDNQSEEKSTIDNIYIDNNTIYWNYSFDISKYENGKHKLSVFCSNNKISNCKNVTVEIDKPRPRVSISYPEDKSIHLKGVINISGKAISDYGNIERVDISIDNEIEKNSVFLNEGGDWYYLWNSSKADNGPHSISVKSYDGKKWSETHSINFTVFNFKNWEPPPLGDQTFQFLIFDCYHVMIPGETYTMYGAYRCKKDYLFHIYLEFITTPDWLRISLEDNYFTTPRDGDIEYFTFDISITKDAIQGVYGDYYLGWRACYGRNDLIASNCINYATDDIWIETGKW